MRRLPPSPTRPVPLCPYTTLSRSRVLRDALIADDAEVIELFLPESGDAERHILQPRGTARRGHDDVMVVARAIAGTALRGRVGRRGGLARLGHGGGG